METLLSDSKEETGIRADAIGLEFGWQQSSIPAGIKLDSGVSYQLIRIIREAITNALHQESKEPLAVFVELDSELYIRVTNSVRSSEPAVSKFGNGLANISFRAEEIGAKVDWHHKDGSMVFELWLPLAEKSAHAS